ncbi:MAG: cell division protein ZapA [Bacteroidales bacterium]|nr:cell division protein ZapA [Bacteroidales bacterium]
MDEQSITLKIAGKDYSLKANSPEMEQAMRIAADDVNKLFAHYTEIYPDRNLEDKLAFVALLEAVYKISSQRKSKALTEELKEFENEVSNYLKGIEQ